MQNIRRLLYFIVTNVLVVATIGIVIAIVTSVFGIRFDSSLTGLIIMCSIWGFGGAFVSLLISKFMAKKFNGVQVIDPNTTNPRERHLVERVYEFSRKAGIQKMPEVGIYESPEPNAFATGATRNSSLVAVSTGLLNTMTEDEVDGVLAHEVAHIANGDMVTLTLVQGVVNSFAMVISWLVTQAIMNILRNNSDEEGSSNSGGGMGGFFLQHMIYNLVSVVFTLLGSIVVCYFSRQREFRADEGGARYSSRENMSRALQKLKSMSQIPMGETAQDGKDAMAAFKISSRPSGFLRLFMTHPPLEERIAALQNSKF